MLTKIYNFIRGLLDRRPVRLAVVRRYADANGSYVGELYLWQELAGIGSYAMIGVSLDTLPLDWKQAANWVPFSLDTRNDFLVPPRANMLRVGGLGPADNERVRALVAGLPRHRMELVIQNRFIEHVLDGGKA